MRQLGIHRTGNREPAETRFALKEGQGCQGKHSSGSGKELDDFVRAYAAAWASVEPANLKAFLPEPGHPLYVAVLREVVCVDLGFRWDRGRPGRWRTTAIRFPSSSVTLNVLT